MSGLEKQLKNMFYKSNFIFYLLLSVIISFNLSLKAEVINKIEIIGNKRISDETIILYGNIKIKEDVSEKKSMKLLII